MPLPLASFTLLTIVIDGSGAKTGMVHSLGGDVTVSAGVVGWPVGVAVGVGLGLGPVDVDGVGVGLPGSTGVLDGVGVGLPDGWSLGGALGVGVGVEPGTVPVAVAVLCTRPAAWSSAVIV